MSPSGWRGEASVAEALFEEPWEFEFFQAVRLLELLNFDRMPPGEGVDPAREVVRFHSQTTFVFTASEVQSLRHPAEPGQPPDLTANLLPLGGAQGPLPDADSARVLERAWLRDYALRDFLDMFHHRLLSLLVQSHKAHHPSYTAGAPHRGRIAKFLYAFFGIAPEELQNRLRVADRSLIFYAGILSQKPRSASGLERLLSDYFRVKCRVVQLIGGWRPLEPDDWTVLGRPGHSQVLGQGALLGTRVWDQQSRFEVNLGPMPFRVFQDFLPNGSGFDPLCELIRFYTGPELEFGFRLTLQAAEMPRAQLGRSLLGWTSWLRTRPAAADDSQVRLVSRRSAAVADPGARFDSSTLPGS